MPGLQDLPFEILEHICELVAGLQPRGLVPLPEVSKQCLAASSRSLWQTIPLKINRRDQILPAVERFKHIIKDRLSRDGMMCCVSVGEECLTG